MVDEFMRGEKIKNTKKAIWGMKELRKLENKELLFRNKTISQLKCLRIEI